jgi:SAM-dependent methyltransferase
MASDGGTRHPTDLDYLQHNEEAWDKKAVEYAEGGRCRWSAEPCWGIWNIPETDLHLLPDVTGKDTLELGCGTGYVSAWLARRGARPVGLDPSANQLATARRLQREFGLDYPLLRAVAEQVPLRDESFDLVISEYGAAIWSDPYRWILEAARVLRPGGELIFLGNGAILMLCVPDEAGLAAEVTLRRPYFGMHRFAWPDDHSVEFHLGYGDWIRVLRANGFVIEELLELRPPAGATTRYPFVTAEWARQWPSEEVWKARKG